MQNIMFLNKDVACVSPLHSTLHICLQLSWPCPVVPCVEGSDQGSSKSTTNTMYAPSSYNDTVVGETLSSISEKSRESYTQDDSVGEYEVRCKLVWKVFISFVLWLLCHVNIYLLLCFRRVLIVVRNSSLRIYIFAIERKSAFFHNLSIIS